MYGSTSMRRGGTHAVDAADSSPKRDDQARSVRGIRIQ